MGKIKRCMMYIGIATLLSFLSDTTLHRPVKEEKPSQIEIIVEKDTIIQDFEIGEPTIVKIEKETTGRNVPDNGTKIKLPADTLVSIGEQAIKDNIHSLIGFLDLTEQMGKKYHNDSRLWQGDSITAQRTQLLQVQKILKPIYKKKKMITDMDLENFKEISIYRSGKGILEFILQFEQPKKGQDAFLKKRQGYLKKAIPKGLWCKMIIPLKTQGRFIYSAKDEQMLLKLYSSGVEFNPSWIVKKIPVKGVSYVLSIEEMALEIRNKGFIGILYGHVKGKPLDKRWIEYNFTTCSKFDVDNGIWTSES